MEINEGTFIRISYSVSSGGQLFDTTDEAAAREANIYSEAAIYGPVIICVGQKHVVLGLDEELVGKEAGTEGDVAVPPEKAFGKHDPKRVQSYPKNTFTQKPVKGMTVKLDKVGEGRVADIIGSKVIVDFNAPLAGLTLNYHYKIEEIVEDPLEQFKGIVRLYTGKEMEVSFLDDKVTIMLQPEYSMNRQWLLWRSRIITECFEQIPAISEIALVESIKRPEKKAE